MISKKLLGIALALLMLLPLCAFGADAADEVISKGKSYTVEYSTPIDNAYPNQAYKSEKKLTDGEIAKSAAYNDSAWLSFYRGTAVSVTVDLESVMAVSSVVLGELQYKTAGIYCSRYLEIYVSENGSDFGFAGKVENSLAITDNAAKRVEFKVTLDKAYKARFVRAVFSSDVFTYVDELSVYGNSDAASAASAEPVNTEENSYAGDVDGIKSVCLMYTASEYTTQTLKPYFAYLDTAGKAVDTMFDSLLFLAMPVTNSADGYMRQADMQSFVSGALAADKNIGALNTVVGELKSELGLAEDYKYPIFISVPFVGLYNGAFGEIDGKTVSSNSLAERSAIVKWYIDYVEQEYSACGYDNLELKGFYWFAESINHSISAHESELVAYFNDYSHEKGYKTMWIPYYSSSGIDEAMDLGFDSVTMQSGYAFDGGSEVGSAKPETVNDAAAVAKKHGLNGIEFEVDVGKSEYVKRFSKYVSAAYGAGIMEDGMITMYQVGDNLYRSAMGVSNVTREIYELTYEFISGNYYESAPVIKEGATITLPVESFANGKLEVTDEDNKKTELKIAHIEKPDGIYFAAEGNGYFEVQTYDCEPGTYTARLSVTDGNNVSNTVEITIIVEPASESGAEGTQEQSDNTDNGENDGNTLVIVLIAVGALLVVAAVVAVIKIRSSKKDKI